jgi:hypothetical protein
MDTPPPKPQAPQSTWYLPLLILGVVGILVRLGAVFYLDFWHDELFSLDVAQLSYSEFEDFVADGEDFHPPGYYFFLQLIRMAGASGEIGLRVANLWWFVVPILGLGLYARRIPESRMPTVVAVACIATGPSFVYHGAELRMYSMLLAWSSLGLIAAHLAATTYRWRWFAVFGLASLAGAQTHYSSAVVSTSIGLAILVTAPERVRAVRGCLLSALIVGLGLLPLLGVMKTQMAKDPAYTISLYRSLLYIGLGVTVPLILVSLGLVSALGKRRDAASHSRTPESFTLGDFALRAALLFGLTFLLIRALARLNLVNTGVALVPASWLILAAAFWIAPKLRSRMPIVLSGLIVVNLALTAALLHNPSLLTNNRLSTITKFRRLAKAAPYWRKNSSQRGIVHIDWPRDNDHFRIKVANPANLKLVEYVRSDHPENVAKKVGQLAANGAEEILLITRGRLTKPMLAGLGHDVSIHRVSRGVAVVTRVVD